MFHRIFDPSAAQVAMLDLTGLILQTNIAWQNFGRENGLREGYDCVGKNYLSICEAAVAAGDADAQKAYLGLLQVIRLSRSKFTMDYPCHSPDERRWARLWVEPQLPQLPVIFVAHYHRASKPVAEIGGALATVSTGVKRD